MTAGWLLHYLGPYVGLVCGLLACLALFVTLKRELQQWRGAAARHQKEAKAALEDLRIQLTALETRLRESEERTALLVAPAPPRSGLNLSKRSQALRLHRSGEPPESIAAALQLSVREVELLLKVHQLVLEQIDQPAHR
jgi:hypothetical protein